MDGEEYFGVKSFWHLGNGVKVFGEYLSVGVMTNRGFEEEEDGWN